MKSWTPVGRRTKGGVPQITQNVDKKIWAGVTGLEVGRFGE